MINFQIKADRIDSVLLKFMYGLALLIENLIQIACIKKIWIFCQFLLLPWKLTYHKNLRYKSFCDHTTHFSLYSSKMISFLITFLLKNTATKISIVNVQTSSIYWATSLQCAIYWAVVWNMHVWLSLYDWFEAWMLHRWVSFTVIVRFSWRRHM